MAADTSFADLSRLSSMMAADGFMSREFGSRGDRLVFFNGIVIHGFITILLVVMFKGETHAPIPLYAVSPFLSFTLSLTRIVLPWFKLRGKSWIGNMLINGLGAVTTVVLPEFVPERWWQHLLHNQTAWLIKSVLLFKRGVVSTSVVLPG